MALTRKMLAAMDIPAEKIDEIITAHTETVNAIKEERDTLKADAGRVADLEKQIEAANKQIEDFKSGDWQAKYDKIKGEYDTYKADVETKAVKTAKEAAYKKLLLDAGISDKRIGAILKVSDIDGVKLDKDGKIEGAESLTENVKKEWADFIVTEGVKGAEVAKPPKNEGAGVEAPSRAAQLVKQYREDHYGSEKEA